MSVTEKTPVSLLSEMLTQKRMQPFFNLIMSGVGTDHGLFVYEVTAGDLVKARGQGLSKKKAKQNAAKAALEKLRAASEAGAADVRDEDDLPPINLNVVSPYEEEFQENAVGSLGELCSSSNLPAPDYHLVREDGPPHAKTFEIACKVSTFEYSGSGRTKQQAKQKAAKAMLQALDVLKICETPQPEVPVAPKEETGEERSVLLQSIRAVRVAKGLVQTPSPTSMLGRQMGARLRHRWTGETLGQVGYLLMADEEHLTSLQSVCNILELRMARASIPVERDAGCVRVLSISTEPELSFLGMGPNEDWADNAAAQRALEFLEVILCN